MRAMRRIATPRCVLNRMIAVGAVAILNSQACGSAPRTTSANEPPDREERAQNIAAPNVPTADETTGGSVSTEGPISTEGPMSTGSSDDTAENGLRVINAPTCTAATTPANSDPPSGDARARQAAQRALSFLSDEVPRWQEQNNCYGCHVQAVSLEAMVVGRRNHYEIPDAAIDSVLRGMLDLPGGAHESEVGLSYHGGQLREPSLAFGGSAFAHYDRSLDSKVRDELLATARHLTTLQASDGHLGDYVNPPVAIGAIQTTTMAIETWRQAHARTADERWLTPLRRAEDWIQSQARRLSDGSSDAQTLGYAILGLLEAGASPSEHTVRALESKLREQQQPDGSWSNAMTTGEAVFVLRRLGNSDFDPAVRRGTDWLIEHQSHRTGAWSEGGQSRAEVMWAVLGLVGVDLASIEVEGITDGEHSEGRKAISARAVVNGEESITRVDLVIDDALVASQCGTALEHVFDSSALDAGPHAVELRALHSSGAVSVRRAEVYTGNYFLHDLGTTYERGTTRLTVRNVAPAGRSGTLELRIFPLDETGQRGTEVHSQRLANPAQGPLTFEWTGESTGRYVAELNQLDSTGAVLQTVERSFVHDTAEARDAQFARIEGSLSVGASDVAENAEVELVDGEGRVVGRTRATRSGRYRFDGVSSGNYRVRASRRGFGTQEAEVRAAPAAAAEADMAF